MVLVQDFDMLTRIVSLSLHRSSPLFAPISTFQDDIIFCRIFIQSALSLLFSVIL